MTDWFCVDCGMEIPDNQDDIQWHKDTGHRLVPRNQVTVYDEKKDDRAAAKKALDFAMSQIHKLVISENDSDQVFAIIQVNGHMEAVSLSSMRARHWLNNEYSKITDEVHTDDFFKTVLNSIVARAQMNGTERVQIHSRIAQTNHGIYYDLGTTDWKIIKITPDGISTVQFDTTCPVFRRTQSSQQQIMPKNGDENAIDKLVDLLRIVSKDRMMFKAHLVALFLEAFPIPIMVFEGMAGSLKTTATSTIKRLVDPNGRAKEDNVSAMSEKPDDLILQLRNRYVSGFDNVSSISPRISDILCRAITGSSNSKRRLYTDSDEAIHSFKRKIVLNGIIPYLDYPDLQTRIVNYSREHIDESNRMTEQEFARRLEEILPHVLGQIFITLCKALREYPKLGDSIKPKTRMSDFEVWGEIISRALGYHEGCFLDRYYEKINEGSISSQDSYPIVGIMSAFMDKREYWEGTASGLYEQLVALAGEQGIDHQSRFVRFPRSANYLTRELVIIQPLLRNLGIATDSYRYTKSDGRFTKNATIITITKGRPLEGFSGIRSPSSPSSPDADLGTKSGEATGEATSGSKPIPSPDFKHKTQGGEGSEPGEAIPGILRQRQFICKTCNAGPFQENSIGSQGKKILDFHKKPGCTVEFLEDPITHKIVKMSTGEES